MTAGGGDNPMASMAPMAPMASTTMQPPSPWWLLWQQFRIEWRLYGRDRTAMFWTFLFPLLILFTFGLIFRSGGPPTLTLVRVAPPSAGAAAPASDASAPAPSALDDAFLKALEETRLKILTLDPAAAEERWSKGETVAQLERDGDGYRLRLNSYLIAQGQLASQAVNQSFLIAQARLSGAPEPTRIPVVLESPGHAHSANYAEFLVPGLIGLNLLTMGLFAVGMVTVSYREKGKFRRLGVTPLPKWVFLGGQIFQRVTVVLLQTAILLLAARLGFGIANRGSYLLLTALVVFGTAMFLALGFALSNYASTVETYGAISNLVFFPMMLLSGVYFGLDNAPRWLQQAAFVLPLSPYLRMLRAVFNDGSTLAGHGAGLAILGAWTALSFWLAVKRFRWV